MSKMFGRVAHPARQEDRDGLVLLPALLVEGVEMQGKAITQAGLIDPTFIVGAFTALLQLREAYQLYALSQRGAGAEATERPCRVILEVRSRPRDWDAYEADCGSDTEDC